jgi:hypothetical protein
MQPESTKSQKPGHQANINIQAPTFAAARYCGLVLSQ